jgi:copper(I)-binding protein
MNCAIPKENITMRQLPIIVTIIAYFISTTAMATDYKAGSLAISSPWSRATPKGSQMAIGYMTIKNNGTTPDRLIGGSIDVATNFELHSMVMENGIAKMRELKDVEIGPGQTIEFKPGGSHVMFVDLKHPLSKGDRVSGTLVFERAGKVQIEYNVKGVGAQSGPQDLEHMQH